MPRRLDIRARKADPAPLRARVLRVDVNYLDEHDPETADRVVAILRRLLARTGKR